MAGTSPAMTEGLLRQLHTDLAGDPAIVLDAAVALEVEDRVLVEFGVVEIDLRDDQLVIVCLRARDNLAIWIDDAAAAEQRVAVLHTALPSRDHALRILGGAAPKRKTML